MNKIAFPKFKKYDGQPVRYIQPKYDGHLMKISVEPTHTISLLQSFTKNNKNITEKLLSINHIAEELSGLPANSQIFAELHCPGRFSTDVPTMLNEANEDLRLTAFAAPMLGGADESDTCLSHVMKKLNLWGLESTKTEIIWNDKLLSTPPRNAFSPTFVTKAEQRRLLAEAIEQKLEGWVLKGGHMENWYKLKPEKELDAFVISTNMSTSASYYGLLKSVCAAVWDIDESGNRKLYNIGIIPGFNEDERVKYDTPKKRATLIGRVLKIGHSGLAARGKLRWPHFDHWRDDKDSKNCTTQQFE